MALLAPHFAWADINMGIFPRRKSAETLAAFKPLAKVLTEALGEQVNLVIPRSFSSFWTAVAQKKFDLVHYNPYHYIRSHKEQGYKVIAINEEFGETSLSSILAVRNDSGIKSIADLKGHTILFGGGRMAMASYIVPTYLLKQAGLRPKIDYHEKFAKNPLIAMIATYNRHAEAAATGNVVFKLNQVKQKIKVEKMRILAESDKFSHLVWAVKDSMPAEMAAKIAHIMASLHKTPNGRLVLKSAEVTAFRLAKDADFAYARKLTKAALGEDY